MAADLEIRDIGQRGGAATKGARRLRRFTARIGMELGDLER